MAKLFLDSAEQGIVVFKIWQSLRYRTRLFLSTFLIIIGLALQLYFKAFIPGIVLVFIGNLFILPGGYDNRVKIGKYDPRSDWEKVGAHKLQEFLALDKKIRKWDVSAIDVSNTLGCFTFFILIGALGFLFWQSQELHSKSLEIITVNGAVLFIPFWMTGKRSIFTIPDVTRKIKLILKLLASAELQERLKNCKVEYFFLLRGDKKAQLPQDVKFRVSIENQHKDFLGLYGQTVMNRVQSTPYPYFYVVLVAKVGYGLNQVYKNYSPDPKKLVKEYKIQTEVEVLVIRQNTRISTGYHTKEKQIHHIFLEGLQLAEKAALK